MPHHLDNPDIRKITANLFLDMLNNIEEYTEENYVCDVDNNKIKNNIW